VTAAVIWFECQNIHTTILCVSLGKSSVLSGQGRTIFCIWLNCKKVGGLIRNKACNSFGFHALRQQHEWV
jgi:hypothetical protein